MIALIGVIGIFLLLIIGTLLLAMMVFNQAKAGIAPPAENKAPSVKIKLKYVALPLVSLLITLILIVWFAAKLPLQVGYKFDVDGIATASMARGRILVLTLLPQLLLTFLALMVSWGTAKLGNIFRSVQESGISMHSLLLVMGNIIGLPQLIIIYAMANIFSYNAYQVNLPPLWIFALVLMVIAGIVLGVFFIGMIKKMGGFSLKDK